MLTVTNVNDAPLLAKISNQTIAEDTVTGAISFTVNDIDNDPSSLILSVVSSNQALVAAQNITLRGSGTNRTISITPTTDEFGQVSITVALTDGSLTVTDSFMLTVTNVNDAPLLANIPNQTISEDTVSTAINFTVYDIDNDLNSLELFAISSNNELVSTQVREQIEH